MMSTHTTPNPPGAARVLIQALRFTEARANENLGRPKTKKMLSLLADLMRRLPNKDLVRATITSIQVAGRQMREEGRTQEDLQLLQQGITVLFDAARHLKLTADHPIKDRKPAWTGPLPSTLVVGLEAPIADHIRQMLRLQPLEFEAEISAQLAAEMVRWTPFRRIIIRFPMSRPGVEPILRAIRTDESPTRQAGVVLLAEEKFMDRAVHYEGKGCNWVLNLGSLNDIKAVFSGLDTIPPRVDLRVPMMISDTGPQSSRTSMWQSQNISTSGILARTRAQLDVGANFGFEMTLPGQDRPLKLRAEVTRTTIEEREHVVGVAARFIEYEGDAQDRIRQYIERKLKEE